MTGDRWQRVQEIFEAAVQLDGAEREAHLAAACAGDATLKSEVEALLRADRKAADGDFITGTIAAAVNGLSAVGAASRVGRSVGPYRLLGELGHGGMGTVYLAERADAAYEARVAIKFVRGGVVGSEIGRRFRAERQILADLAHPNIARLLDGGATEDGLPYLVMERIEGEPIDAFCERRRLALRDRLLLFCQVCDAVHHAHRHLIVHRDIKPSNILVTGDGTPKLLDFGVAKLLDPTNAQALTDTGTAGRLLTPSYASPEQVRGDAITTATDIYSLGVLLFRLLSGRLPFDARTLQPHELARAILEQDPEPPSRVATRSGGSAAALRFDRDLDAVVLTALEKDPGRRYASVERFADDLRRHLDGLPVHARPATTGYRIRKFIARNRRGVLAGAGGALLLIGLTGYHMQRLARERDFADAERRKAAQVTEFLEGLFIVSDPGAARGRSITAREVVDSAVVRLPVELEGQPALQAAMLYTLGGVYNNLNLAGDALPLLQRGLALRRAEPDGGSPTPGDFLFRIGIARLEVGQFDSAAAALTEATARLDSEYPIGDHAIRSRVGLANAHRRAGRLEEADSVLDEALVLARARTAPEDSSLAIALATRAALYLAQRRGADAEAPAREAWERLRERFGDDAPRTISALNTLGQAIYQQARFDEAEPIVREVLELNRRVLGERHAHTGTAWNNLAALLRSQGRTEEATDAAREALDIYRESYGERHQRVTLAMTNLASMLLASGEPDEAERLHREALGIKLDMLDPGHIDIAVSYNNLASVLERTGRYAGAERAYRQALEVIAQGLGVENEIGSVFLANLGRVQEDVGRVAEAETTLRRALTIQRDALPTQHARTATTLTLLGGLLVRADRAAEAESLLREALRMRTALLDPDHWEIEVTRSMLGACIAALGGTAEAEELLTSSAEALRARFGPEDDRARTAIERAVDFYAAGGDAERADAFRSLLGS